MLPFVIIWIIFCIRQNRNLTYLSLNKSACSSDGAVDGTLLLSCFVLFRQLNVWGFCFFHPFASEILQSKEFWSLEVFVSYLLVKKIGNRTCLQAQWIEVWLLMPGAHALQQKKPQQWEAHIPRWRVGPITTIRESLQAATRNQHSQK